MRNMIMRSIDYEAIDYDLQNSNLTLGKSMKGVV